MPAGQSVARLRGEELAVVGHFHEMVARLRGEELAIVGPFHEMVARLGGEELAIVGPFHEMVARLSGEELAIVKPFHEMENTSGFHTQSRSHYNNRTWTFYDRGGSDSGSNSGTGSTCRKSNKVGQLLHLNPHTLLQF